MLSIDEGKEMKDILDTLDLLDGTFDRKLFIKRVREEDQRQFEIKEQVLWDDPPTYNIKISKYENRKDSYVSKLNPHQYYQQPIRQYGKRQRNG